MQEQVHPEGLQPMGRTHTGVEEEFKQEGAEETVMGRLQIPVPHPLCIAQNREEVEELSKKQWKTLAWDKKGGGGQGSLIFIFIS